MAIPHHVIRNERHVGRHPRQESTPSANTTTNELSPRALLGSIQSGLRSYTGVTSWAPMNGGYRTSQIGAVFSIKFYGQSLTWYGFYDDSFPFPPKASARYRIDNDESVAFRTVPSYITSKPLGGAQLNLPLFQTKKYPLGEHTLEVTFNGDTDDVPLTISDIGVVETDPDPYYIPSSSVKPTSTPPRQPPTTIQSSPSSTTAASSTTSPSSSTTATISSTTPSPSTSGSASLSSISSLQSPAASLQSSAGSTASAPGPITSSGTGASPDLDINAAGSDPNTPPKKPNTGAIAGGIVAAVLILLLLIAFFLLRRRRRRARQGELLGNSVTHGVGEGAAGPGTPQNTAPDPFPAIRQFELSPVSVSGTQAYMETTSALGSQSASSEKARLYFEQQRQMTTTAVGATHGDWPHPMNAKHAEAGSPATPSSAGTSGSSSGMYADSSDARSPESVSPSDSPSPFTPIARETIPSSPPPPLTSSTRHLPLPPHAPSQPVVPSRLQIPSDQAPTVVRTVQDEDSGIRLMQQWDTGGFVEVLPPSYTAH